MPRTGEPFPAAPGRLFRRRHKNASSRRNCPPVFRWIIYNFRCLCLSLDRRRSFSESPPASPTSNPEPPPSQRRPPAPPGGRLAVCAGRRASGGARSQGNMQGGAGMRCLRGALALQRSFFRYPVLFYCKNVAYDIKYVYVFSRPCAGYSVAGAGRASMRTRGSVIQRGGATRPSPAHAARSSLRAPQKKP